MTELPIDVRNRELRTADQFGIKETYQSDLEGVLIPRAEIEDCVAQLGSEISAEYHSNPDFYPICVLKGAIRFFVDLLREVDLGVPYSEGVVHSSRYHAGPTTDTPTVQFFHEEQIEGKDVLLVEDILDEGYTLATLRDRIEEFDPSSIRIVTLFDKTVNREVAVDSAFTGFTVPDEFFIGYGLDYDEQYRDLRHLGVLDPEIFRG
ncbi:hypoxanthine phosphoribosyltransferase [Halalkaliarchaeum desulfuricum]|uniref:hypoxanthine phosphoribosyltransferase n=1 Tax=Halalkaliarchaeum desulfuricum TaxID=2055893 RepID=A0A343TNC2_9EURY|nr:hypoxanthine phosphoribosyltransferase [Halalkaliarchaeum desulfuricum]AUX10594.1 hypoxanthine phosphoribosyltransferase [Halalkaliarchaeum desulfuricum]